MVSGRSRCVNERTRPQSLAVLPHCRDFKDSTNRSIWLLSDLGAAIPRPRVCYGIRCLHGSRRNDARGVLKRRRPVRPSGCNV